MDKKNVVDKAESFIKMEKDFKETDNVVLFRLDKDNIFGTSMTIDDIDVNIYILYYHVSYQTVPQNL